jgi:hypothetical protein
MHLNPLHSTAQPAHRLAGFSLASLRVIFHKAQTAAFHCSSNIEMTPLCKVDLTLAGVRRASEVRGAGGVDEQKGIRSA